MLLLTHAWSFLAFGATFWIDSSVFATFGAALHSAVDFRSFYDAAGTFMYSHIGIGLPAVWAALWWLPTSVQWPVLALGQHALAITATAAIFLTAHRLWPSWWHLAGAALLSVHPFYQSMHNALMTESISSSLLLLGIALTLRLWSAERAMSRDYRLLLLCIALVIQFRSYNGVMLAAMAALVLWQRRAPFSPTSTFDVRRSTFDVFRSHWQPWFYLAATCLAATAFLPATRWAVTGRWFTAGLGTNQLLFATWVNATPSPDLLARIEALGWLPADSVKGFFERSFDYPKSLEVAKIWNAQGRSDSEVRARLNTLSRMIERDSPNLLTTKIRCGLVSSGWTWSAFTGDSPAPIYQHFTAAEQRKGKLAHLRWLSWLEKSSYRGYGENFFLHTTNSLSHADEAQRALWDALRQWLRTPPPSWRDPFHLADLTPDIWATIGLLGIGICLWRCPFVGLVLALPLVVNFGVTAFSSLGGPRYAYALLPVSALAATTACALLSRRFPRSAPPAAA